MKEKLTINYNNKKFIPLKNSKNGEVNSETIFSYYQDNNIIWGDYSGGDIVKGTIVGTVKADGSLFFYYQHINKNGEIKIGKCQSTPEIMSDNKIKLYEKWEWLNGDKSRGISVLIEC